MPEFYVESREEQLKPKRAEGIESITEHELAPMTRTAPINRRRSSSNPWKTRRSFWTETTDTTSTPRSRSSVRTDVAIFDKLNEPYKLFNYNLLIFLLFAAGLAIFGIIVYPKFVTNYFFVYYGENTTDTTSSFFYDWEMWLYVWLPILLAPCVLWFLLMAPVSRMLRGALREDGLPLSTGLGCGRI